ncbi:sulfite exporter TauE/SafE family protein [Paraflavitalea sp. CAU 1676]|uniref:sulfite exporter TauE/SafE family protein n=1 Tax=Paraflavitalea sp. CAU 1676 TaxID=3032598 RepID=UPI0023DCB9E8|nr:sulfite exporter TauE/SafE family protein [Paraflavitalea sp. CAU 1676]MDF2192385.1 sulfite exporter TauE/SafE family protein [Paraflavitalea sp. CAU 1676]
MWTLITSGFIMGLFGSLHCIGMCGPLVMALPLAGLSPAKRLRSIVLFHSGRLLTYSTLGLLFGLAGRRFQLAGWQQGFSISLGILLLLLFSFSLFHKAFLSSFAPIRAIQQKISQLNIFLWRAPHQHGFLLLGMANGLLPCGMVYLAVAAALTTGDAGLSSLFMLCFGLGTAPALLGVGYGGLRVKLSLRNQFRKAVPFVMMAMGIVLILRGLDLNIPFISPLLPAVPGGGASCH